MSSGPNAVLFIVPHSIFFPKKFPFVVFFKRLFRSIFILSSSVVKKLIESFVGSAFSVNFVIAKISFSLTSSNSLSFDEWNEEKKQIEQYSKVNELGSDDFDALFDDMMQGEVEHLKEFEERTEKTNREER